MERFDFDDIELTFELRDGGERVLLVHAIPFVSWYGPLIDRLAGLSTLSYRRRLRAPDSGLLRPLTVAEDAATCARLMDHVGWPTAHVVGHSYGALVGLQLALDHPDHARSIALLEPAARGISSSAQVAAALQPVIAAYKSGDASQAIDGFLRHVCGDGYRIALERVLPHAFDEALEAADLFFQAEMPAVQTWSFGPDEARCVNQPVLNVLGTQSVSRFVEGSQLVRTWFPDAEQLSVPDAGHLMMVQNPAAVAQGLIDFYARHPLQVAR
ncbi:MAG TPA: alpha/beta hydrolase [Ilumatobacteraceae bacterium]|nr:alpha/beta hydrolase [Ilumatobacteraceae bacterium]